MCQGNVNETGMKQILWAIHIACLAMSAYTHTCIHTYPKFHIHTYTYITYIHIYIHYIHSIKVHIRACMHTFAASQVPHTYIDTCIHYIHICIYIYIYTYIVPKSAYIHTYTAAYQSPGRIEAVIIDTAIWREHHLHEACGWCHRLPCGVQSRQLGELLLLWAGCIRALEHVYEVCTSLGAELSEAKRDDWSLRRSYHPFAVRAVCISRKAWTVGEGAVLRSEQAASWSTSWAWVARLPLCTTASFRPLYISTVR